MELLQGYCKDKAPSVEVIVGPKEQAAIDNAIMQCLATGLWKTYWKKALEYYKVQHTIFELYSKEIIKQTPLGPISSRELIQIY